MQSEDVIKRALDYYSEGFLSGPRTASRYHTALIALATLVRERDALSALVRTLREGMSFYGDPANYESISLPGSEDQNGVPLTACPIEHDSGEIARDLLHDTRQFEEK